MTENDREIAARRLGDILERALRPAGLGPDVRVNVAPIVNAIELMVHAVVASELKRHKESDHEDD